MINNRKSVALTLAVFVSFAVVTPARASEVDELKATVQAMQNSMEQMQARIAELEQENHKQKKQAAASRAAPPPAAAVEPASGSTSAAGSSDQVVTIAPTTVTIEGRASEIKDRPAMDDQQVAAPRPNDLTLDPKYRGFVPIPNTPVLIKFNAKPRVDFTDDPQNTGNPDRFVEMPEGDMSLALTHYQAGFKPLLYGIVVALILSFFLKETGPASRKR